MGNKLAERFKEIRTAAGDTPAKAAEKVGISRQGYNKWESGDTKNMTLNNLLIFCEKYNVEVEPLIRCVSNTGSVQYVQDARPALNANEPAPVNVIGFPNPLIVELQAIATKISPAGLNRLIERASQLAEDYPAESLGKDASSH
jgi:transcriptional regulator with XRE-family HTH domain